VNTKNEQDPFVYENVLVLITSGIMDFYIDKDFVSHTAGTCGILKRNQLVKVVKRPDGEKPFASIYIYLDQETLKKFSLENDIKADIPYVGTPNLLIDVDPFLKGYFESLMPYLVQPEKLTTALAKVKTIEIIELLLRNPVLKNFLFDFNEPHKIDLEAYMNTHFMYNIPLAQFAKLTGRSLSTFRRDFVKIFEAFPEKWIQQKRLEEAYFLISQKNKKPSCVHLEVGFENLSHFSYSFKKKFGVSPTELIRK
jgi:AraC-type DNA-binding domain-containing proteins